MQHSGPDVVLSMHGPNLYRCCFSFILQIPLFVLCIYTAPFFNKGSFESETAVIPLPHLPPIFYVHLAGLSNQVYLPQDVLSSPSFHLTEHPTTAHHPRSTTRAFPAASVACNLPAPLVSADDVPPEDPLPLPLPALFSLGCVPPLAGGQPGAGVYPGGGA